MADPQYVKDFIRELTPFAVAVGDQYGIDPETIITQAAIETGWGKEVAGNNYFGVKSHGKPGGQNVVTHEEINGQRVKVTDSFRKYNNLEESVADYGRFLSENPRYAEALAQSGPEELAGIANAGYATSSNYPNLVKGVGRTVTRNIQPLPPGEIPTVASLLDTQRAAPTPAIQSPNAAFLRQNTSPLGENTGLQAALQQVATTKANQVTPAIRRPELPAMGTPDLGAVYAGIYPQQQAPIGQVSPGNIDLNNRRILTDGVGGFKTENSISIGTDQGEVLIPTVVNGKQLSEQAAIDHYQRTGENLGTFQTPQAADRYAESLHQRQETQYGSRVPSAVPQSQIDRNTTPSIAPQSNLAVDPGAIEASVGALRNSPLKAALARIASGAPNVPQSQIERTPPPIGQSQIERGTTPVVADTAVSRKPRVTVSTPYTTPQRMAAEDNGNVARVLPLSAPFVPEDRYIEPRNAVAPAGGYLGPFAPDKGLERLASPAGLSVDPIQTVKRRPSGSVVAPTAFTTELRPMQIANPAWKATPAAGTPMSGGLSRDAVALRAQGQAMAQQMAQIPRMITVQRPVQVAIQPRPVAAALARQPLRIAVNGAGVAPQPITVAQGLSPSEKYNAAIQAATQAAAQGGKYYNPNSYENRYAQNSGGGGAPRSLLD